jgi:hypothetical protein
MAIIDLKRVQRAVRRPPMRQEAAPAPKKEAAPAPAPAPAAAEPEAEAEMFSMMNTKAELTAGAEAAGIEVQGGWTKAQILDAMYPGE